MTIPPAAVIALRELSAEMREQARKCQTFTGMSSMDPVWVAGYIDACRSLGLSIAEYVDKLDALVARVEPQESTFDAELALRQEWWLRHGCPPGSRYSDDGEMQCNSAGCLRDFKREPLHELAAHVDRLRQQRAAAAYTELRSAVARVESQEGTSNGFAGLPFKNQGFAGLPEQLYPNTLQSYRAAARVEPQDTDFISHLARWHERLADSPKSFHAAVGSMLQDWKVTARVEPQDEHLDPVECGIRERVSRQQREQYIYDSIETATADRADLLLRLDTTRTLLAAWQKRAYEAEVAMARVEPPQQEQDWTERARKWIVRETHTNTHGLASFCEEARQLIRHAYVEPSPQEQRDFDVLASTLEAVKLLVRNGDYTEASAEFDKAVKQVAVLAAHRAPPTQEPT